ncbi:peptidoglycan recognition protein family protein [Nonomuraea angiospora]|uniref:peptidoglycan recognition protein family protein n=1 Tax=Nonomuraea angiospora TaxID=46172 RepID=UPI0029BE3EF6|nr:N-acetylmuramoyl-L-alanine amidase [Nonomuraea angiospora]MDX3101764.1 N-acetylmuramoyl-L-alanine amidase [Nonomuraea angiospora]
MPIDLITRAEWRARAPKGDVDYLARTRGVKVHYTGGRVDPKTVDDHDLCAAAVRGIQRGHMDGNGWIDIGYSFIACAHRKVFVGRGLHQLPAANGPGLNSGHYAILGLVGNSGLTVPPDDMLHAIRDAIEYVRAHGGAGPEIKGHRDGYSTDCPGPKLYDWVQAGAPRPGGAQGGQPKPGEKAPTFPGRLMTYPPSTRGADVYSWQAQMRDRGWDLIPDGTYGPRSRDICTAFQRDSTAHGWPLDDDGVVGPATWRAAWERPVS